MLKNINHNIDTKRLESQARDMDGYEIFSDPKSGTILHNMLIKKNVTGYAADLTEEFRKILGIEIRPRFLIQKKGYTLPFHTDRGTTCAVNFILSTSRDPIRFETDTGYSSYQYKQAIVDVSQRHEVTALKEDRYLFKLSIFDLDYNEVIKRYDSAH